MRLILLITLISVIIHAKDLTITASQKKFATIATAVGSFAISEPFLNIKLNKLSIRRNEERNDDAKILSFKLGIAKTIGNKWKVERWAEKKDLNIFLSPGQSYMINDYTTDIAIDGINDLSAYWIVIQIIQSDNNNRVGTTYSHSQQGIFK